MKTIIEVERLDQEEYPTEEGFIVRHLEINKMPDKEWLKFFYIKIKTRSDVEGDIEFFDPSEYEKLMIPKKGEKPKKYPKIKPYISFAVHKTTNALDYVNKTIKAIIENTNEEYL